MSDPGTSYRSRDEVQEVRQTRDPITSFREKIISKHLASAEEIKVRRTADFFADRNFIHKFDLLWTQELEVKIRNAVDEAGKKSKAHKEVSLGELVTDVYANPKYSEIIRNTTPVKPLKHTTLNKAVNV